MHRFDNITPEQLRDAMWFFTTLWFAIGCLLWLIGSPLSHPAYAGAALCAAVMYVMTRIIGSQR
jgi:hypothetical protein